MSLSLKSQVRNPALNAFKPVRADQFYNYSLWVLQSTMSESSNFPNENLDPFKGTFIEGFSPRSLALFSVLILLLVVSGTFVQKLFTPPAKPSAKKPAKTSLGRGVRKLLGGGTVASKKSKKTGDEEEQKGNGSKDTKDTKEDEDSFPTLPDVRPPYAGLVNLGQTCFLNTIMQSLYFVPLVRKFVLDNREVPALVYGRDGNLVVSEQNMNGLVHHCFRNAFYEMQEAGSAISEIAGALKSSDTSNVDVGEIDIDGVDLPKKTAKKKPTKAKDLFDLEDDFGLEEQSSVDIRRLVDALGIDHYEPCDLHESMTQQYDRMCNAWGAASDMTRRFKMIYEGKLNRHIACTKVDYSADKEETFFSIPLQVKGFGTLQQSLRAFLTEELLQGGNQYSAGVHGKQDAMATYSFVTLPPILTFNLRRFSYNTETGRRSKIVSKFEFPEILDMSDYVPDLDDDGESSKLVYELYLVVIHEMRITRATKAKYGGSGGHYYCFAQDPSDSDSFWIEFNDRSVNFVNSWDAVQDSFGGDAGIERPAYMLSYARRDQIKHLFRDQKSGSVQSTTSLLLSQPRYPVPRAFLEEREKFIVYFQALDRIRQEELEKQRKERKEKEKKKTSGKGDDGDREKVKDL